MQSPWSPCGEHSWSAQPSCPHVVYLHSALAKDRIQAAGRQERQTLLIYSKWDCNTGLGIAGLVKLSMLCIAAAVHAGFGYFQRQAGYTRTGSHGTRVHGRETGQWHEADLAVAHWLQHTSRDGDMQLHVHSQIGHVAKAATDGKWRAPDSLGRSGARAVSHAGSSRDEIVAPARTRSAQPQAGAPATNRMAIPHHELRPAVRNAESARH
jgi:hypothetical protein